MGLCNNYHGPNRDFPDWKAPKYRCCCGCCHIEKAVFWLTVISIVFAILGLVGAFYDHRSLSGGVITILTLSAVLYALFSRKPGFFLPFLIVNGIALVLFAVVYFFIAMSLLGHMQGLVAWAFIGEEENHSVHPTTVTTLAVDNNNETTTSLSLVSHQKEKDHSRAFIFVAAVFIFVLIFALSGALMFWIYSLYWRAWKYLRAEGEWLATSVVHPVTELNMKRLDV